MAQNKKNKTKKINAASAALYFWKRSIQSVIITDCNFGDKRIELISFKGEYMGQKIVPGFSLYREIRSLGRGFKKLLPVPSFKKRRR